MKQRKAVKRKYFGSTMASVTEFGGKYFVEGYYYADNGDDTSALMPGLKSCTGLEEAMLIFDGLNSYQDVVRFVKSTSDNE